MAHNGPLGKAKRCKTPALKEGSRRKEAQVQQDTDLGSQKTEEEGEPTVTTAGPRETPCSPGLEGTEKGKLQPGVLRGWD